MINKEVKDVSFMINKEVNLKTPIYTRQIILRHLLISLTIIILFYELLLF